MSARLSVYNPYFAFAEAVTGSIKYLVEVDAVTDDILLVVVTVPGGAAGSAGGECPIFAGHEPRRGIIYVHDGAGRSFRRALKRRDFTAFGIEGVGVVNDADGKEKG